MGSRQGEEIVFIRQLTWTPNRRLVVVGRVGRVETELILNDSRAYLDGAPDPKIDSRLAELLDEVVEIASVQMKAEMAAGMEKK